MGATFREKGTTFDEDSRLPEADFAAHGGVFPVIIRGTGPVGTVGVSGLPQAEDHALVAAALDSFLNRRDA